MYKIYYPISDEILDPICIEFIGRGTLQIILLTGTLHKVFSSVPTFNPQRTLSGIGIDSLNIHTSWVGENKDFLGHLDLPL